MFAKCPKCEKVMTSIKAVPKDIYVGGSPQYKGVIYCCPLCSTALSASMDPLAVRASLVASIKKLLGR